MKSKKKNPISNFKIFLLSATILINPSSEKQISKYLLGTNFEYIYDREFSNIEHKLLDSLRGIISVLRFPGGGLSDQYSWIDGVGPINLRKLTKQSAKSTSNANLIGTDEIVKFCRKIAAEPFFTVNYETGDPAQAKAWVQYCNEETGNYPFDAKEIRRILSRLQRVRDFNNIPPQFFSALRASSGINTKHDVKFWEIGNEVYLNSSISPQDYAKKIVEFSKSMKEADGEILIGVDFNDFQLQWNDSIVDFAKDYFDFVSIHHYNEVNRSPLSFNFYSNRFVSQWINVIPRSEVFLLFEAYGDQYMGHPLLEIRINDKPFKRLEIKNIDFADFRVELGALEGKHKISLGFVNDLALVKGKDRNIFIRNILVSQNNKKNQLFDTNDEYYLLFHGNDLFEQKIVNIKSYLKQKNCRAKIAVTEGNVGYGLGPKFDREQTKHGVKLKSALFVAGMLNSLIREEVWMFNYWNLLTKGYYGLFRPDGHVIPSYYVLKMYAKYLEKNVLDISLESPVFTSSAEMQYLTNPNPKFLDAVATTDAERSIISLMVINRHPQDTIEATVNLQAFPIESGSSIEVHILSDSDGRGMEADNETDPENITIKDQKVNFVSSVFSFKFPPHSVSNLRIPLLSKESQASHDHR